MFIPHRDVTVIPFPGGLRLCNVGAPLYEALRVTRLTDVLAVGRGGPGG